MLPAAPKSKAKVSASKKAIIADSDDEEEGASTDEVVFHEQTPTRSFCVSFAPSADHV